MPAAPEACAALSAAIVSGQLTTHAKPGCCLAVVAGALRPFSSSRKQSLRSLVSKFILLQFSPYFVIFLLLGYTLPGSHCFAPSSFSCLLAFRNSWEWDWRLPPSRPKRSALLPSLQTAVGGIRENLTLNLSGLSGWCCWELWW